MDESFSFDAGQSRKPSSQKRAKSFEKEPETIGNWPACLNNTHLVILAIKNSPSGCNKSRVSRAKHVIYLWVKNMDHFSDCTKLEKENKTG